MKLINYAGGKKKETSRKTSTLKKKGRDMCHRLSTKNYEATGGRLPTGDSRGGFPCQELKDGERL